MNYKAVLSALVAAGVLCAQTHVANATHTQGSQTSGEAPSQISVTVTTTGVALQVAPGASSTRAQAAAISDAELATERVQLGDTIVPGRIVALAISDDAAFDTSLRAISSVDAPYAGHVDIAARLSSTDESGATVLQRAANTALPGAPVTVLRDGHYRGQRLVTLALSQLYTRNGANRAVRSLNADLRGATLASDPSGIIAAGERSASVGAIPSPSPYAAALNPASWMRVTKPGLHRVTAAALSQAGLTAANACVTYRGTPLAVHEPGNGTIVFYAQAPGDRYNSSDVYWLIAGGCARMTSVAAPAAATGTLTAFERGSTKPSKLYYGLQPGNDGDHWFAAEMRSIDPSFSTWAIPAAANVLPGGAGNSTYTVRGVTRTRAPYAIVLSGNGVNATVSFQGNGQFEATGTGATSGVPTTAQLTQGVWAFVNEFRWQRPVQLNFAGGGAAFGVEAAGVYQVTNATGVLYDVTDPLAPKLVQRSGGGAFTAAANANFEMSGANNVTDIGVVTAYAPSAAAAQPLNKRAYYIAPASLAGNAKLAELIALRNTQGWTSQVIAAESLYALWGHGHVSPDAIRQFLQYQYSVSTTKPEAVILVGDGNYDWRGILDDGLTFNRLIPPYLSDVDRFRGEENIDNPPAAETACEPCYAQLDGNAPLDDAIPDLIFGRMPVGDAAQLNTLVDKIVRYETINTEFVAASWRTKFRHMVDNYWKPAGETNIVIGSPLPNPPETDPAGPFWAFADHIINNVHATGPLLLRAYYDPYNVLNNASYALGVPQPGNNPPAAAGKAAFNFGASFITYIGHSNEQRMGKFEVSDPYGNAFLYDFEVKDLTNVDKLPIVLQMTCLTGSFHKHELKGQSVPGKQAYLDETLVLQGNNTGAIATWSSTGLGVMYGHQPLLTGFFQHYWKTFNNASPSTVGAAASAGYLLLHQQTGTNAEDSLRTYSVLGDPLTRGRAFVPGHLARENIKRSIYMPVIGRK